MTDRNSGNTTTDRDVELLLRLAGPRPSPPAEVQARVRSAFLTAWEQLPEPAPRTAATRARRVWGALALAVTCAAAVGLAAFWLAPGEIGRAGTIVHATGGYTVRGSEGTLPQIATGAIVQTAEDTRMQIALSSGATLRLDARTRATLHGASEIWLHDGRIYVDAADGSALRVVTPNATITDIGTQFEVEVARDALSVAVRSGAVELALGNDVVRATALPGSGERLVVEGIELSRRETLSTLDARWAWTESAAPPFELDGRSVYDYLDWAARESGRIVVYEDALTRQRASLHRFSGAGLADASPESVERTLRTTRFGLGNGQPFELVIGSRSD